MKLIPFLVSIWFVIGVNLAFSQERGINDDKTEEPKNKRPKTTVDISIFSLDFTNTKQLDDGITTDIYIELTKVKTLTRMGKINSENGFLSEHGFVTNTGIKTNLTEILGVYQAVLMLDFGIGYGVNYNSLSPYLTLNTSLLKFNYFEWESISAGESTFIFFPSKAPYFSAGTFWKPFLKYKKKNNTRTIALHAAFNLYPSGGEALFFGIGFGL